MSEQKSNKEIVVVEEYSLWDFLKTVQTKVQEGYEIDFDSNTYAPVAYGTLYTAGLMRAVQTAVEPVVEPVVSSRKKKAE